MGTQYRRMSDADRAFIARQKIFFLASCSGAEVNLSPKGYDALRVIDDRRLLYLDYPGSGDRTARDIRADGAVTLLFAAFEGPPLILRLFAKGELVEKGHPAFAELFALFGLRDESPIRRLIVFTLSAVERSCGEGIPRMAFEGEREGLRRWAEGKGADGSLADYIDAHTAPPDLTRLEE